MGKINFKLNKKILIAGACVIIIAAFLIIGISSLSRSNTYQLALDNLAEARFYMKQASNDSMKVQFYSGMREDPYEINGVAEKTVPFAVLNIVPKDNTLINLQEDLKGMLTIGTAEPVEVTFEQNPHGNNYMCDIERLVEVIDDITFKLLLGDEPEFKLENSMNVQGAINWEKALEIAADKLSDPIKDAGKFECYVKIVQGARTSEHSFWYIQFVPQEGKSFFAVIDPAGNVVGTRTSNK